MKIELPLEIANNRPIVRLPKMGIRALLDTGAAFPVWTQTEAELCRLGAKMLSDESVSYKVFGGKEVSGRLYELPSLALSEWFFFPTFPIVATYDEQMGDVSMILPFTLFRDVETTISPISNKVIFDIPDNQPSRRLKIESKDGKLGIYTIA